MGKYINKKYIILTLFIQIGVIYASDYSFANYATEEIYREGFASNELPSGWEIIDNTPSGGCVWEFGYYIFPGTDYKDYYPMVDMSDESFCNLADTTLISNSIDISDYDTLVFFVNDKFIIYGYSPVVYFYFYSDPNYGWIEFNRREIAKEQEEEYYEEISHFTPYGYNYANDIKFAFRVTSDGPGAGFYMFDDFELWGDFKEQSDDTEDDDSLSGTEGDDDDNDKNCGGCATVSPPDPSVPLAFGMFFVGLVVFLISRKR